MSEKAGKESQYSFTLLHPLKRGLGVLVSEPRFRRFWKCLILRMYLYSNMLA